MVCQDHALERVLMAMRVAGAGVREHHPSRLVQSLYFDTPTSRSLRENLDGLGRRDKIRLRWYGEATSGVRGSLERKIRRNALGWKEVMPLEATIDIEGTDRLGLMRTILQHADARWIERMKSRAMEPACWIAYRREYYVTADGRIRLTLDRELRAWDQQGHFMIDRRVAVPLPHVLIVEAKCAPEHDEEAMALMQRLPLMVDKCSKFVMASSPRHGPLVSLLGI